MSVLHSGLLSRRAKAPGVRLAPSPPTVDWPSGKAPSCNLGNPRFDSEIDLRRAQGVHGCMPDCQSEGPGSNPGGRSDERNARVA
jgi:hypothetical protein